MGCQRCGACCKLVGVILPYLPRIYADIFRPKANGWCRHLEEDGDTMYKCAIYEMRPTLCNVAAMNRRRTAMMDISEEESEELQRKACKLLRERK